jgi:hypothetical protein
VSLSGDQLKALARQGAAQRYAELQAELAALKATFPELGRGGRGRPAASASAGAGSRRRRSMNAAQRKEVSERMTKYWAARRAEKASGGGAAAPGKGKGRRRKAAKKAAE